MTRRGAGLAVVVLTMFVACDDGDGSSATLRQDVLTDLVEVVFVPGYEHLDTEVAELAVGIDAYCATPTEPSLVAARAAWDEARGAWMATRPFRFGPVTTTRAMAAIDFTIDGRKIDELIAGSAALDAGAVAALGSDQRGLGAIEHVLFATDPPAGRGCDYLAAAVAVVSDATSTALAGWVAPTDGSRSFADQLRQPAADGMYASPQDAYEDIVNSMIFALSEQNDSRIARASGDLVGEPDPQLADRGRARRALGDVTDVIEAVIAVAEGGQAGGVAALVAEQSRSAATSMARDLAAAAAAVTSIPQPLYDNTDPAPAHAAHLAILAAEVTLQAEVASVLGVTLTFGDADGDA